MKKTIAVIGVGSVGSTIAHTLLISGIVQELILLDTDEKRCAGQAKDLSDMAAFLPGTPQVHKGSYEEVKNASIVIISAGKSQRPGETRLQLLDENKQVLDTIITHLTGLRKDAFVILVTNPLDILTFSLLQKLDIPRKQIFGTGTYFDSYRLKALLATHLEIDARSIEAWIVGEHGDSQVVAWSATRIAGNAVEQFGVTKRAQKEFAEKVKMTAYEIIMAKGSTCYGIAATVNELCYLLLRNSRCIIPISWYHEEYGACMSLPVLLTEHGIVQAVPFAFSKKELEGLEESAAIIRSFQKLL